MQATSSFIGNLKLKLEKELGFDFYFEHPDPTILEPLGVVGTHNAQNNRTAKTGGLIQDVSLQIDIYLPIKNNQLQVSDAREHALKIIGRKDVSSSISEDNSTNRKLWRINIRITNIIF